MAKVSLTQASKDTGISLSTLSRWRKKGKISAESSGHNSYLIDTSEYDRIETLKNSSSQVQPLQGIAVAELAPPLQPQLLEQKILFLEQQVAEQKKALEKLEIDKDDYKDRLTQSQSIIERQTLLLSDFREDQNSQAVQQRKKLFGWL